MNDYRKFRFAPLKEAHVTGGFWGKRLDDYMGIIASMESALLCPTNAARLLNFGIASGAIAGKFQGNYWSDGDCFKFIEGCCHVFTVTKDKRVKDLIDQYIPWIVGSQEPDGYIGTQTRLLPIGRWTDLRHHELYNHGHFFTMAAAHQEATGETVLVECAMRLKDYLSDLFSPLPIALAHFCFNPSQIMGLADLYRVTGDKKCITLADIFVTMRGSAPGGTDLNQTRVKLREETMATGHAVTSMYLYAGAADVYAQTGETALFEALERIWTDLTGKRIYITGGVCPWFVGLSERGDDVHEAHGDEYNLPHKVAYNETCANIGAAMWAMRMLALTENTQYGDWAEQIMYNAGISGASLDLKKYFYSNPLAYRKNVPIKPTYGNYEHKSSRRFHTHGCWCCPPQLFRTISSIGRWVYGVSDEAVYINLFADCDYENADTVIRMRTDYPWDGKIQIRAEKATDVCLKIRIPSWCKHPTIDGNAVKPGEYHVCQVNTGDEMTLNFQMETRLIQANPNVEQARGMLAVMRGPVVYCAEGCDNASVLDDIYLDVNAGVTAVFKKDLLDGVVTLSSGAQSVEQKQDLYYERMTDGEKTTLNMIPYYAWANREETDMSVWFPKA